MTAEELVWLDGAVLPVAEAAVGVGETGWLQGIGLFETLWAAGGRAPAGGERHHRRLAAGCARLGLTLPGLAELEAATRELRGRNGVEHAAVRVRWTLGEVVPGTTRVLVTVKPATTAAATTGPAVAGLSGWRRHSRDPLAGIKATSYAGLALLGREARARGWDEALYGNEREELVEGSASNAFFTDAAGALWTPPLASGCLPGVTRERVLELARAQGWTVREEPMALAALERFRGGFLTNSQIGMRPIATLDGRELKPFDPRLDSLRQDLQHWREGAA